MTTGNDPNERLSELLGTPTPGPRATDDRSLGDRAGEVRDRAQETAEQARLRAQDIGREAADRVDSAMTATGERISDAARTLRERAPGGQVGDVAEGAARALERSGDYLQRADVQTVRRDLETIVRDHPLESLAVGLGVGFLLARGMRSRRS